MHSGIFDYRGSNFRSSSRWYEIPPHVRPGWIAMNHYDRAASVALIHVVNSETIDLEPTLLKGPSLKVRPPLSDHLFRRPRTLTMSASGSPGLKRYRSVVTARRNHNISLFYFCQ